MGGLQKPIPPGSITGDQIEDETITGDKVQDGSLTGDDIDESTLTGVPVGLHKTSHQDGGGDELDVTGLSGELADPQPPKTHGNEKHTGTYVEQSDIDSSITTHAGDADAHHTPYTDGEADARIALAVLMDLADRTLDNNVFLMAEETGETPRELIGMSNGDDVFVGNTSRNTYLRGASRIYSMVDHCLLDGKKLGLCTDLSKYLWYNSGSGRAELVGAALHTTQILTIPVRIAGMASGATAYLGNYAIGQLPTESMVQFRMPACTVKRMSLNIIQNDLNGATTFTLRKNGADQTDVQVSVASSSTGQKTDTGSVSFSDGDLMSIKVVTAGSSGNIYMNGVVLEIELDVT